MAATRKVTAEQAAADEEFRRLHVVVRAQLAAREQHRQRPREATDVAAAAVVAYLVDPEMSLIAAGWLNGFLALDVDASGQVIVTPIRPRRTARVRNPYLAGAL